MAAEKKKNRQQLEGRSRLRTAQRSPPVFIEPMAAQLVKKLPEGDEWLYEVKLDGYRGLLMRDWECVETRSRKDKDLTQMYPGIVEAGLRVNAKQAVIDGEIVLWAGSLSLGR
jgi:bifunctional non-homologous end joining protein LigD